MASFIQKKERVFRPSGDDLVPRRSVGRIKNYTSCTDRRAWVTNDEPRRQYILEMIKSSSKKGSSFGKYIPIEVLIDILLQQKIIENEKLKARIQELEALLDMYSKLELSDEQKRTLQGFKDKLGLQSAGSSTASSSVYGDPEDISRPCSETFCAAGGGGRVKRRGGKRSRSPSSDGTSSQSSASSSPSRYSPKAPLAASTPIAGSLRGTPSDQLSAVSDASRVRCPVTGYPSAPTFGAQVSGYPSAPVSSYPSAPTFGSADSPGTPESGYPSAPVSGYPSAPMFSQVSGTPEFGTPVSGYSSAPIFAAPISGYPSATASEYTSGPSPYPVSGASSNASEALSAVSGAPSVQVSGYPDSGPGGPSDLQSSADTRAEKPDSKVRFDVKSEDGTTASEISGAYLPYSGRDRELDENGAEVINCGNMLQIIHSRDLEIEELTKKLNKISELITQNEELKKQLTHSQLQLVSAQGEKEQLAKTVASTKPKEVSQIEAEIASLRDQGTLTTEQETEVIKKELEVLRKYCDNLSHIQEENDLLRKECEDLKNQIIEIDTEREKIGKGDDKEKAELKQKVQEYAKQIELLKSKLSASMEGLLESEDIENLKRRSELVDDVLNEREELRNQLGEIPKLRKQCLKAECLENENKNLSNELNELKKYRAEEAEMAEKEIHKCKNHMCNQDRDIAALKSDKCKLNECLEGIKCERNELSKELSCFDNMLKEQDDEIVRLRSKSQESDLIRLDRDRLQLRIEELEGLEEEVITLIDQIKDLSIERDSYKRQVCELDCIIADQEDEIKQLLYHIDRLSNSVEKQQEKVKIALEHMQRELDKKTDLLLSSEDELQLLHFKCKELEKKIQEQERTINQITCSCGDQTGLYNEISKLEKELDEKQRKIYKLHRELDGKQILEEQARDVTCACTDNDAASQHLVGQLACTCNESGKQSSGRMTKELEEAHSENIKLQQLVQELKAACQFNHIDIMLAESKQAVDVVINEVQSFYDGNRVPGKYDEDNLYDENRQLRKHSMEIQELARNRIEEITEQMHKLLRENAELREENDLLQSASKGIETDLKHLNIQLEETVPSSAGMKRRKGSNDSIDNLGEELLACLSVGTEQTSNFGEILLQEELDENASLKEELSELHSKLSDDVEKGASKVSDDVEEEASKASKASDDVEREASKASDDVEKEASKASDDVEKEASKASDDVEKEASKASDDVEKEASKASNDVEKEASKVSEDTSTIKSSEISSKYQTTEIAIVELESVETELTTITEDTLNLLDEKRDEEDVIISIKSESEATESETTESTAKSSGGTESEATVSEGAESKTATEAANEAAIASEEIKTFEDVPVEQKYEIEVAIRKSIEEENKDLKEELKAKDTLVKRLSQDMEEIPSHTIDILSSVSQQFKEENDRLKNENLTLKEEINRLVVVLQDNTSKLFDEAVEQLKTDNTTLKEEITRLEEKLKERTAQLAGEDINLTEINDKLEAKILELQTEMENYATSSQHAFKESENGIQELKVINIQLEEQISRLKDEIDRLANMISGEGFSRADEVQRLRTELECRIQEMEDLKDLVRTQEKEIDGLKSKNRSLSFSLQDTQLSSGSGDITDDKCKKIISKLKSEIQDLKCENNCLRMCLTSTSPTDEKGGMLELDVHTRNARLEAEIAELKEEIECMQICPAQGGGDDINRLKAQNAELEARLKQMQSQMTRGGQLEQELENELSTLRSMIDKLTKENSGLSEKVMSMADSGDDQIASLLAKIKELESAKSDCEGRVAKLREENKDIMDRLEEIVRRGNLTESEFEAELSKWKSKVSELEDKNKQQQNLINQLKGDGTDNRVKELEARLKQLEADKAHLESRLAQITREQDELVDQLRNKIMTSSSQATDLESEVIKLRAKVKELETVIKSLESQLKDSSIAQAGGKQKEKSLETDLSDMTETRNKLMGENSSQKKQIESLENDLARLQADKDGLLNSLAELEELRKQISILKNELQQVKTEYQQDKAMLESFKKENDSIKKDMKDLTNKLQLAEESVDDRVEKNRLNELIKKLEKQVKDCEASSAASTSIVDDLEKLKAEYERMKREHDTNIRQLQTDYDKNLALAKEQYERDLKYLEARHNEGTARLQSSHEETLNETVKNFEREIANLQKQLEEMSKKLNTCQESLKTKESDVNNLQKQLNSAQDEVAKLKKDFENEKVKSADLEKQVEKLGAQVAGYDKLKNDLESEKGKNAKLSKDLDEMKQALNDEQQKNSAISNELANEKTKNDQLSKALSNVEAQSNAANDELNKLKKELENQITQNTNLSNALSDIEAKSNAANDELNKLMKDLENEKTKNAELSSTLDKEKTEAANTLKALEAEKKKNAEMDEESAKLKKELENEKDKISELSKALSDVEAKSNAANDELNKVKKDLENEKSKSEQISKDLNAAKQEAEEITRALVSETSSRTSKDEELSKSQKSLENERTKSAQLSKDLQSSADEIERLKKELEEKNQELSELKKNLEALIADSAKLKIIQKQLSSFEAVAKSSAGLLTAKDNEIQKLLKELEDEKKKSKDCAKRVEDLEKQLDELKKLLEAEGKRASDATKALEDANIRNKEAENALSAEMCEKECITSQLSGYLNIQKSCRGCQTEETCPCGALINKRMQQSARASVVGDKLTKATALIVEIIQEGRVKKLALSRKTFIVADVLPSVDGSASTEGYHKHILSLEEERPINLTKSIEHILEKALKSGLENLTFDELSDLHTKTTNAANIICQPLERPSIDQPKVSLMRRIATLESELETRHKKATEKMTILDRTLQVEKQRLLDMKNALILERKRNNDLVQRIGLQTRENANIEVERDLLKRQTSYHEDRVQKLIVTIEEEKCEKRKLEEALSKGKNIERSLKALLETEKQRSKNIKNKANETIDVLRIRLDEALDSESQLKMRMKQSSEKAAELLGSKRSEKKCADICKLPK